MGKGADTKQSILDTASELASKVGLQALTIGTLATRTGLSKSGLFAHFRSKEALQLAVLRHARDRFVDVVIRPALAAPRGEPRMRLLFDHWLAWSRGDVFPGGCLFTAAAFELDDQPGVVRDRLVADERDLTESVALMFTTGISEGHFRADADATQFARDLQGVIFAFIHATRLLGDPLAEERARRSFERLLRDAR